MTPFRSIAVFYHVARTQSVVAAAEYLHVTPSAVSQQLRSLEEQIGSTLTVRSGRTVRLTEAGERYFELIAEDIEHIIRVTDQLRGVQAPTRLSIRATPTIATKWLLPRLDDFLASFPGLEVRIDASNEPTDFSRDRVDIEIRHGTGRWQGLNVQPLASEWFLPVCAPTLAAAGSLSASEITDYRLIHSVKAQVQWKTWFNTTSIKEEGFSQGLYFDRSHMSVDAAALGLGIALESNLMMSEEVRSGRLIIPVKAPPSMEICTQWLVCPHQSLRLPQVRHFIDWITDAAERWSLQQREIFRKT